MKDKKSILVLAPRLPYPPVGGDRLRIYKLCSELAKDFSLSLLSMCDSMEEMNLALPHDGIFKQIDRVFHSRFRKIRGCLSVLPSARPLQIGYYQNPEFSKKVKELLPMHDAVLAHLIRTGEYVRAYSGPKILEMTDAISLNYTRTRSKSLSASLRGLAYRAEAARLLPYERALLGEFDVTVLTSQTDKEFLMSGRPRQNILVCSNGVDTHSIPFDYSPDGATIIFIGNNTALPNADAVLFFADHVLPIIRARRPSTRFKVIGRIDDKLRTKLSRRRGVITTGALDRIDGAVKNASVGVCPVRFGAGIQNKMLEYMAFGVPAVTSPIGLEGIDATDGVQLLVANSPQDWAEKVLKILTDPEQGRSLAYAAREFVENFHSWEFMIRPLRQYLRDRI